MNREKEEGEREVDTRRGIEIGRENGRGKRAVSTNRLKFVACPLLIAS